MDAVIWILLLSCIYLVGITTGLVVLKIKLKREERYRLLAEIKLIEKKRDAFKNMLDQNSKAIKNFEDKMFRHKVRKEIDDILEDL
jgi:hypothetical protein